MLGILLAMFNRFLEGLTEVCREVDRKCLGLGGYLRGREDVFAGKK